MKGQCIQPITEAKSTKGSKTSDDLNLREAKKIRSKSQDPPNSKNSSDMKTKKGDKEDVRSRGKENAKEAKDNKNNKDNKKFSKDNAKEKQTTSPKKGRRTNDEEISKQEKNNRKPEKGREAYSKDDMEIEKNKKQKRKEHNEKAHKSIQTDKSTLKSRDDHSVHYGNKNGGYHGYPNGDSEVYGHRKSDANSDGGYFRDSTGGNSYNDDGNIRRGFKHHFSSQKYYALVEKPSPPQKPSSKPKARFGPIDSEDNPGTSQSRGKVNSFQDDEDRYDGPDYIRSRFSAKSEIRTRNPTTLSMYSVKSSRVLDDEEDLERCSSKWSDRENENGIERPTDELIDLEDSLDNRPRNGIQNGYLEVNGDLNGDRNIDEYNVSDFENSGSHKVDILKITTPGDSSGKEEENGETGSNEIRSPPERPRSRDSNFKEEENSYQTDDVLERRLQALKSNGSPLLRAGSPEGNIKERRRSERFPDNTNLLANSNESEKSQEQYNQGDKSGENTINGQGSPQQSVNGVNREISPQQSARAKRSEGSPQMSARTLRNGGSPDRSLGNGGSPDRNLNERRRSERFPDNQNMLQNTNITETKPSTSVKKSTSMRRSQRFPAKEEALPIEKTNEQRKLKQSNSFRGRSRNPVRRYRVSKNPQETNISSGYKGQNLRKGPQSLDRNVLNRQSKEENTENKSQDPVTESFTPRPPSRPRSHDGRYSVDSLYLPDKTDDTNKPEEGNNQQTEERPHLVARDSLYILRQENNIDKKDGSDKMDSEEDNNQYSYSGYGYGTSHNSPQRNGEMLEQSADELKTTVEELEKRFDAIENEDEDNEYASGNEWKTRFETQTEMNQQLERQILMLENKVEESKKNLKDAGKSPQEGQLFIDLADANPQMVKQLEKEKLGLINSIRDLEWRLDQESKAYHRANDERKQYVIEIQSTKGNIYQIQRQRAAGDSTYRTPRVENGGNIPDDQRILDPKKGPIRKTAGVKTLPSLDSV